MTGVEYLGDASFAVCFDKSWKNWVFYVSLFILVLAITVSICVVASKNKTRPDDSYRYEITVTTGIVGYYYDCDSYLKTGTVYRLYRGKNVYKTIDVGVSNLIEVDDRFNPTHN